MCQYIPRYISFQPLRTGLADLSIIPANKEPSTIEAALIYFPNEDLGKKRIIQLFFFNNTPPILTSIDCFGVSGENRTRDPNIKSVMLYRLSYGHILALVEGLEPPTLWLTATCTTDCAIPEYFPTLRQVGSHM